MGLSKFNLNKSMNIKIAIVFLSIIIISATIFFVLNNDYTDQSQYIKLLIQENDKVNDAIQNRDWNALYDLKDKYWREVKNSYIDSRNDFIRNKREFMWIRYPIVRLSSYKIDTLRFGNDSISIEAVTKNYTEAYHLFTFWHRYNDTMLHSFGYINNKWYLRGFGHSNTEPDTSEYTIEKIDSVFYKNWGKYYKKE